MFATVVSRLAACLNGLTRRHLEWIYRVTTRRTWTVLAASLLLLLLSVAGVATIRFDSDIFQLFPTRQPALRLLLDSLEWTGSAKEAFFLLEGERQQLPIAAKQLSERLQALQIDGKPAFRRVTWQVYDQSEAKAFSDFIAYAAARPQLFIAPQDVSSLREKLALKAIDGSLRRLSSELSGQFGGLGAALATADPLYLRDLILPRLKSGSQALDLDPASPYFMSRDGRILIMIAEPAQPVQDTVFARRLVAGINQARAGLPARISCAGAHISAVLDEAAMKSNILACIISSLVVVLALFYATYRRILPTLLLPLIIACGVLLALGAASLLLPAIHIISFAFMALIIGLGTDYSIHLYDRFHTERAAGRESLEALHLAVTDTGHGLFTAAATTAVPFLALTISDVRALSELGLLVGLGVIFSLYSTLFFLPPLLLYMERRFPIHYRPISAFGLHWLWRLIGRRPGVIVTLSLSILLVLLIFSFRTSFDGELKKLQPQNSESFLAQEKIERHLSLSPKQMLVAIDGTDLDAVLARSGRVELLAEGLLKNGQISAWSSLGKIVNSAQLQGDIASSLARELPGQASAETLREALVRHGFEPSAFQPFIDGMAAFGRAAPVPAAEALRHLASSPLRGVVDRHLVRDSGGYHSLTYLYYNGAEFDQSGFLKALARIDRSARASSIDLVSQQLSHSVQKSFAEGFLLGGVLVLLLLIVHFESAVGVCSSFFPVAAGTVAMLGLMAMLGMGLNFMNAMVLVTIVGMGSDYGLHLQHRIYGAAAPLREREFVQAGRSILLSALTTIAGFGSLAFADYPALASIGWATNFGIVCTALFALVTLPALMALNRTCSSKKGEPIS